MEEIIKPVWTFRRHLYKDRKIKPRLSMLLNHPIQKDLFQVSHHTCGKPYQRRSNTFDLFGNIELES